MNKDRLTKQGNLVTTCIKCGHRFTINADEIEFYRKRGLNLPKHCKVCLRLKHADKTDGHKVFTKDGLLDVFPEER